MDRRVYRDALGVQNAANLSGLARSLYEATLKIWGEAREEGQGTEYVNKHPVVKLMLHQMAYLAFGKEILPFDEYTALHDHCEKWANAFTVTAGPITVYEYEGLNGFYISHNNQSIPERAIGDGVDILSDKTLAHYKVGTLSFYTALEKDVTDNWAEWESAYFSNDLEESETCEECGRGEGFHTSGCEFLAHTVAVALKIAGTHSISAGLDYPSIGPEHAYLHDAGHVSYVSASDLDGEPLCQDVAEAHRANWFEKYLLEARDAEPERRENVCERAVELAHAEQISADDNFEYRYNLGQHTLHAFFNARRSCERGTRYLHSIECSARYLNDENYARLMRAKLADEIIQSDEYQMAQKEAGDERRET